MVAMAQDRTHAVAASRALLTESDREYIASGEECNTKHQAVSRVRSRIRNELAHDLLILQSHHPELYSEFMGVVHDAE